MVKEITDIARKYIAPLCAATVCCDRRGENMKPGGENDIIFPDILHFLQVCAADDFLYTQGLLGCVCTDIPFSIK